LSSRLGSPLVAILVVLGTVMHVLRWGDGGVVIYWSWNAFAFHIGSPSLLLTRIRVLHNLARCVRNWITMIT
jgi:hypothetical protein